MSQITNNIKQGHLTFIHLIVLAPKEVKKFVQLQERSTYDLSDEKWIFIEIRDLRKGIQFII